MYDLQHGIYGGPPSIEGANACLMAEWEIFDYKQTACEQFNLPVPC